MRGQDAGKEAGGGGDEMGKEKQEKNGRREEEGGRVRCLQNQSEGHVERLIFFPFLIRQSPAAWRLGGPGTRKWDGSGQRAGDLCPAGQAGMVYAALGLPSLR